MKRKNRMIVIIVMLILLMQLVGCGKETGTWEGYEADAANGLRVKRASFTDAEGKVTYVDYDMEGNITGSSEIYCYRYESFFKKALGMQLPFSYSGWYLRSEKRSNGNLNRVDTDNWGKTSSDGTIYSFSGGRQGSYFYLADGRIVESRDDNALRNGITKYTYDDEGRLIREDDSYTMKFSGLDVDSQIEYTYVGDSFYLQGYTVGSHKSVYKYDYDNNDRIIRVEENTYDTVLKQNVSTDIWELEYDENGNLLFVTKVFNASSDDPRKLVDQYDENGNVIETCEYKTFGSKEYMTKKTEYRYEDYKYEARETDYRYEANSDYSIVNLINTIKGEWETFYPEIIDEDYDKVNDCWDITYYTQEEIDQYMHDKEFQKVN